MNDILEAIAQEIADNNPELTVYNHRDDCIRITNHNEHTSIYLDFHGNDVQLTEYVQRGDDSRLGERSGWHTNIDIAAPDSLPLLQTIIAGRYQ